MALPLVPLLAGFAPVLLTPIRIFFAGLLIAGIRGLVRFALVYIGVGLVTYVGMDYFLTQSIDFLNSRVSAIPPELFEILKFMGLVDFITIITSAMTANIALKLTVGATKAVINRNSQAWKDYVT